MVLQLDPCKPKVILTQIFIFFSRTVILTITRNWNVMESEEVDEWIWRVSWRGHGRRILPELGEINTVNRDALFFSFYHVWSCYTQAKYIQVKYCLGFAEIMYLGLHDSYFGSISHYQRILITSSSLSKMLILCLVLDFFLASITISCPSGCIYLTSSAVSN